MTERNETANTAEWERRFVATMAAELVVERLKAEWLLRVQPSIDNGVEEATATAFAILERSSKLVTDRFIRLAKDAARLERTLNE